LGDGFLEGKRFLGGGGDGFELGQLLGVLTEEGGEGGYGQEGGGIGFGGGDGFFLTGSEVNDEITELSQIAGGAVGNNGR
jgi:hypothetical protein